MALLIVVAVVLGWWVERVRVQRDAVAAIVRSGGRAYYDWESTARSNRSGFFAFGRIPKAKPPGPQWLHKLLGPDHFGWVRMATVGPRDTDAVMASVGRLPRLESLDLSDGNSLTDAGMVHLRETASLNSFHLAPGARVTAEGLASLCNHPQLRSLTLSRIPLTDADLAPIGSLTDLAVFHMGPNRVTTAGLRHLHGLVHLRWLTFNETRIEDLSPLEGMNELETLAVAGNPFHDQGLAALGSLPALRLLNISNCRELTDAGLVHLGRSRSLVTIVLYGTPITDAGLASLAKLATLGTLHLSRTRVAGPGLEHLAALPNLRILSLSDTPMTDAGAGSLASLTQIQSLDLSGTKLGDEGVAHLAGLTSLKGLRLSNTQVTDAGLAHLAGLKSLALLDLTNCRGVTDAGLAKLAGLKGLTRLILAGTQVTPAAIASLERSTPNVKVTQAAPSRPRRSPPRPSR